MFSLSEKPIDSVELRRRLSRPDAGALVVFEGWVRAEHRGRAVDRLEYEAFAEMATAEGAAIMEETQRRFPGCEAHCVHRAGVLEVGELAVWIGVTAAHRAAAFAACRAVIEDIKRRLPVWKKEYFLDGAAEWVDCTREHNPSARKDEYHSRQTGLPELGTAGQARLAAASVLVVGAGGLGGVAADALAAAGAGRMTLLDPGLVELSNLPRQPLYSAEDVGLPKAVAAEARLRARNPFVAVDGHACAVNAENVRAWAAGRTVVLDCTDQFSTRFLLHDACRNLGVPLVQAAAGGWEGSVNTFGAAGAGSGCLHCLWPGRTPGELAAAGDCAGGAVFGPAVNALALMQASEAIRLIVGLPVASATHTLFVSWLDYLVLPVAREARADCPVCRGAGGAKAPATPAAEAQPSRIGFGGLTRPDADWQIIALDAEPVPAGLAAIPLTRAAGLGWAELRALAGSRPTLVVCARGVRSVEVVRQLREEGLTKVYSLAPEEGDMP